jgi:hypothetical protein
MPTEIRKIVFTVEEVRWAAVDFCLRSNIALPHANIGGLRIADDMAATVTILFTTANPAHPNEIRLSRDHVAAALIRFCMENQIPLPRHAQKVLQVQAAEQTVALMMKVDLKVGDKPR